MDAFPPWPQQPPLRRVFLRDLVMLAHIGVYPHEEGTQQRVRVNIEFGVEDEAAADAGVGRDDLSRTVSYERVVQLVRRVIGEGHVRLVETLAERVAMGVLAEARVRVVRVKVEKLDVFAELESVGVEIERWQRHDQQVMPGSTN